MADIKDIEVTETIAQIDLGTTKSKEKVESIGNSECTICFEPRYRTFLLIPCGHATFCETCADRILEDGKKCPTCQVPVTQKIRVFQ